MSARDECENCHAHDAAGTFDLDGVETLLCPPCATYRRVDGSVVIPLDTETNARRERLTEAFVRDDGHQWTHVTETRRDILRNYYATKVDAALSLADEELDSVRQDRDRWQSGHEAAEAQLVAERRDNARLRAERNNLRTMYDVSERRVHDLINERDDLRADLEEDMGVAQVLWRQRNEAEATIARLRAELGAEDNGML